MAFNFFDHLETAKLLGGVIKLQPANGRGLVKKLAAELDVASPHVSQFLSGQKIPTVDQVYRIARFFHWSELETEYAITLVEFERAQFHEAKAYLKRKLRKLHDDSRKIKTSVDNTVELPDHIKARFYSSWIYSAVRLFCSLDDGRTYEQIRDAFPEQETELDSVITFLVENRLMQKDGMKYQMARLNTFIPKGSPYLRSHHANWHLRAVERSNFTDDEEIILSVPISMSKVAYKKYRQELQNWIKQMYAEVGSLGDAEEVVCLNIDLFKIVK